MLQELNMLSPDFSALRHHSGADGDSSSEAESIDGVSDGAGTGPLLSPSCIPAYGRSPPPTEKRSDEEWKNDVLLEYFAGWALAHASSHRKFVAITTFPDRAYSKWGHVSQDLKTSSFADDPRRLRFSHLTNSCRGKALDMSDQPALRSHESRLSLHAQRRPWFVMLN